MSQLRRETTRSRKTLEKEEHKSKVQSYDDCFATVLPLVSVPISCAEEFEKYCDLSPLERLAAGLDLLEDDALKEEWPIILDIYERFLTWKEDDDIEKYLEGGAQKATVAEQADQFAAYLYKALTHTKIREEYRRYLVL